MIDSVSMIRKSIKLICKEYSKVSAEMLYQYQVQKKHGLVAIICICCKRGFNRQSKRLKLQIHKLLRAKEK